jgi:mono/diheme cytochrome c family protein
MFARMTFLNRPAGFLPVAVLCLGLNGFAAESQPAADRFRAQILPILQDRCYDCHGDGENKGSLAFDQFKDDDELLGGTELWWSVAKNIRAGIMPPKRKPQLTAEEKQRIDKWIQADVFGLDPANPDPGRVTIRRLNRVEYRHTIRDLMGIDFDTELEFPPDDTGYGFDNIGDVLSVSPLLLEKYVQAAETIVKEAVPTASKVMPVRTVEGPAFRSADGSQTGDRISFYDAAVLTSSIQAEHAGEYEVVFEVHVDGEFAFDPGRCRAIFSVNGEKCAEDEFVYAFSDDPDRGATFRYAVNRTLPAGEHQLTIELQPLVEKEKRLNRLDFRVKSASLHGPADTRHWVAPENYAKFFPNGPAPDDPGLRRDHARKLLEDFASRAFRRPVNDRVLAGLVGFAEQTYAQPAKTFEQGIARALVAVLASPRFLFRLEADDPGSLAEKYPRVDEWTLASRLSYFFWSSMPDAELFALAAKGELRKHLPAQIERLLKDPRSAAFVENFTGQWLQARNIEHLAIEPLAVLGFQGELEAIREKYGRQLFRRGGAEESPELTAARARSRELMQLGNRFNPQLRTAMRRETELVFEHVLRGNRSVREFLDSDYTFLNQRLAEHYGIAGVEGEEMQWVKLPPDSPRGGVLTQGNMLLITSNPTRTSPVKRGLFILENILGTPTPPAPPNVPELEEAAHEAAGHKPTLRELLARHREDALCSSCHNRIDPLGLAFENFTALGTWRDQEEGQPIDPSGDLITGEAFSGVQELKQILVENHRTTFYRCLTEKLLTYALGRGIEYYDELTIDRIVSRLEQEDGRFHTLVAGIVESAPFQQRRKTGSLTAVNPLAQPESQLAQTSE